jgi:hypothetical protein
MTTLHGSQLEAPHARRTRTLTLAVRTVALVLAAFTLPISARAGRDRSFIRLEDEMFHSTEKFIVRDATASGSVVSGTTDFLDTLSLAVGDLVTRAVRFVGVVR